MHLEISRNNLFICIFLRSRFLKSATRNQNRDSAERISFISFSEVVVNNENFE